MDIRPQTYVWVACFFVSWKCEHVSGIKMNTYKQAVLDCYGYNSSLESNTTVLKNYMNNHTEVTSIWVGRFEALLPWIEIRGCYNISLLRNSLSSDEHVAKNSPLCQMKCMNRRYFAFSQKDDTCVCFDEHEVVKRESDNASFCQECKNQGDCSSYAVVYKVFKKSISIEGYDTDCMSYECSSEDAVPTFHEIRCSQYCLSVCRNGRTAESSKNLQFAKYYSSCATNHFTYPLLHSDNPVKLCNTTYPIELVIDIWVGVFRQRLHIETLDKTVLYDFTKIDQYISHCYFLSTNNTLLRTDNCSVIQDYKCFTEETEDSTTSNLAATTGLRNDLIVGIVVSIVVIILILVVLLAVLLLRKYSKDKLSLNTAGREDHYTNEMDNCTIISDYQQLDKVKNRKTKTKPYDQLHVKHAVDSYPTDDHSNTLSSREEHNKYESIENTNEIDINKVTLEYEVLDKTQQDKITKAYDQLHYTHVVDTDSTNNHSTTIIESEEKHKTSTNTTSLEYEELNNAEKDKSVNLYDELNTTNEGNFNSNISKTIILTEEHINNESIEAATAMDKHTVTLEYEQLDIAGKDEGMNVYDQLYVTP